jgi:ribonuclease E
MATCPACEFDEIDTEDYDEGDKLSCPECGENLILLGANELEVADDEDDDDDDDDLEDDDEDLEEDEDDDEDLDDEDADENEDFEE